MSRKIKLHTFNVLFQLFAYLADKTGGWRVFVRPKLLLGSLIVGLGLATPKTIQAQNQDSSKKAQTDTIDSLKYNGAICYDVKVIDNDVSPEKIHVVVEQMPQFPGGHDTLIHFIAKNIHYPIVSYYGSHNGGKVFCQFVVEKDGNISDIAIIRSLDTAYDKEAIRVLKLLPKFIPGKQNGQVVRVYYTLPVIFKPN
jgi:TonB family protein